MLKNTISRREDTKALSILQLSQDLESLMLGLPRALRAREQIFHFPYLLGAQEWERAETRPGSGIGDALPIF